MKFNEVQAEMKLRKKALSSITKSAATTAANSTAKYIKGLIIKRIYANKDLYGQTFGGYNKSYNKRYAYGYAVKTGRTPTKHASSSNADKLRLTGQLLTNLYVKVMSVTVTSSMVKVTFKIAVPKRFQGQAEGLQSTTGTARNGSLYSKKAYYFMGISKQLGEQGKILRFYKRKLNGLIRGSITQKRFKR